MRAFARAHGYVTTIFGRRVHMPGINDKNPTRRNFFERAAINAPLQGAAADIIKRAMVRMPDALKAKKLSAKMLLQVHDELVFEVPEAEAEETAAVVKKVMSGVAQLSVPLVVETGTAKNWADAHRGAGQAPLAHWIRANRPGVPVILASGVARKAEQATALCEDVPLLAKPYRGAELLHDIRAALAARDGRSNDHV